MVVQYSEQVANPGASLKTIIIRSGRVEMAANNGFGTLITY